MVLSEFDANCTLLIYRSPHHYVADPGTSSTLSLVAAATGGAAPAPNFPQQPDIPELQKRLESNRDAVKLQALKELILWVMAPDVSGAGPSGGSCASRLLMTIIRFVLPSSDRKVTKMLQLYWEMVDKTRPDGTLKEEMILVCNKLREDLLHANEFIRGSTLRLLCKIKFVKLLEPLVEAIVQNLSHHHAYVRRNAVMCIYSMVRSFGTDILPNAAEEVQRLLLVEGDLSTKRNALLMLIHCDLGRAVRYALSVQDNIGCLGDIFQLALLDLLRKVSREDPAQTRSLLKIIVALADTCSPAVAYEGGSALVALSSSPVALKAATRAYVGLLTWHADNTVKLIVLDRLSDILDKHKAALEDYALDVLRALSCPSLAVRKKALHIAMKLVTSRTVHSIVNTLRKELVKAISQDSAQDTDGAIQAANQQLLVRAIRTASKSCLDAALPSFPILLDLVTYRRATTGTEAVLFIRELTANYPEIRPSLLRRLIETFPDIPHGNVARGCVWIIGEFCVDVDQREAALQMIFEALGPLPLPLEGGDSKEMAAGTECRDRQRTDQSNLKLVSRTVVLPDGTYGTLDAYEAGNEAAALEVSTTDTDAKTTRELRRLIVVGGDFLLASAVSVAIARLLVVRSAEPPAPLSEKLRAQSLLMVASLLALCRNHPNGGMHCDSSARIMQAMRVVMGLRSARWVEVPSTSLEAVLESEKQIAAWELDGPSGGEVEENPENEESADGPLPIQPDEMIEFRQVGGEVVSFPGGKALDDAEADLNVALGDSSQKDDGRLFERRLARVQQMTGLGDPVYVEAFLQVNQYDLIAELLIINRTAETLQNINVELATHGDLKIVERPLSVTLRSGQAHTVYASIKVQSTETGIIFGHVTFDKSTSVEKEFLVLNELHVDLLDFVKRTWIGELNFRSLWAESEWENKLSINKSTDVKVLLEHIMEKTNMTVVGKYITTSQAKDKCATAVAAVNRELPWRTESSDSRAEGGSDYVQKVLSLPGLSRLMESSFFAVNLYSRSIFGEDALANVSVERLPGKRIVGNVRIRSRSQGVALSLGDRVAVVQRSLS